MLNIEKYKDYMQLKSKKILRYYEKSTKSNTVKSSRRLLFNFQNPENKKLFHSDYMYGGGSGILIKYSNKYFLLTARHVLKNSIDEFDNRKYQNISPFWIMSHNRSFDNWKFSDFLYPHKYYELKEIISDDHQNIWKDIALVELFPPINNENIPDNFLDLDKKLEILPKKYFNEGRMLLVSGYPESKNPFEYEDIPTDFTHKTALNRNILYGFLKNDEFGQYISLNDFRNEIYTHKNLNGFSGGIVTDVQHKGNAVKFLGMVISGGGNKVRFIPSWLILNALKNYKDCTAHIIDPGGLYTLMEIMQTHTPEEIRNLVDFDRLHDLVVHNLVKN